MSTRTNGMFPTQFDETTNALFRTLELLGVSDEELLDDRAFLANLMAVVGRPDPAIPVEDTIELMDVAYIGLIYHRHIPFIDEDTGQMEMAHEGDLTAYSKTLARLSQAIVEVTGAPPDTIMECAKEAAEVTVQHLREPESTDAEGLRLHTDIIAMVIIGLLVHRFVPTQHGHE